jgi:hypothetical protein
MTTDAQEDGEQVRALRQQLHEVRLLNARLELENLELTDRVLELEARLGTVRHRLTDALHRLLCRLPGHRWLFRKVCAALLPLYRRGKAA